jgi:hypothetical protein
MKHFDPRRVKRWRRDVWRGFEKGGLTAAQISGAMVLAGVVAVGTDVGVLSELTGLSEDYVRKVLRRLRKERILVGQTIRASWLDDDSATASVGAVLDAGAAAGIFARFVNDKRSAAQKARKPETRARGPRRPKVAVPSGAMFTPKQQKSNPLYGLPEWKEKPPKVGTR